MRTNLEEPVIELINPSELEWNEVVWLQKRRGIKREDFIVFIREESHVLINAKHENANKLKELAKEIMTSKEVSNKDVKKLNILTNKNVEAQAMLFKARWFWRQAYNAEKLIALFSQENAEKEIINTLHELEHKTEILPKEAIKFLEPKKKIGFIYGYIMGLKAAEQE